MRSWRRAKARPLEGVPLGIKDLFCTKGVRTTACSNVLGEFTPTYESTVTQNLCDAGAVMLGKLNKDEFAMGSSNETSRFGPVVNPWRRKTASGALSNTNLVPGGSSGGSSAAVAADLCLGATATDTGGSIRQPAALTGTVGIKPTYGRCSRWGIVAFASSLDQAGPIAQDRARCGDPARHDGELSIPRIRPRSMCPCRTTRRRSARGVKGLQGRRAEGISRRRHVARDRRPVAARHCLAQGRPARRSIDISLPHTKYALPAYYIVAPAECSSNLARYDGVRYGLRVPART